MNRKGFSYIETLVALALLSITLMPLLAGLYGAYRNEAYARNAYAAQLRAQAIMAVARDAVLQNADAASAVTEYTASLAEPPLRYGVWLDGELLTGMGEPLNIIASVNGIDGTLITVIVWDGGAHGRAYGLVPVL